jgi:hypothetical protein
MALHCSSRGPRPQRPRLPTPPPRSPARPTSAVRRAHRRRPRPGAATRQGFKLLARPLRCRYSRRHGDASSCRRCRPASVGFGSKQECIPVSLSRKLRTSPAAHITIVDLAPNAATRFIALIGQHAVFGSEAPISASSCRRRPGGFESAGIGAASQQPHGANREGRERNGLLNRKASRGPMLKSRPPLRP